MRLRWYALVLLLATVFQLRLPLVDDSFLRFSSTADRDNILLDACWPPNATLTGDELMTCTEQYSGMPVLVGRPFPAYEAALDEGTTIKFNYSISQLLINVLLSAGVVALIAVAAGRIQEEIRS